MGDHIGFDFSEFSELIKQLEQLGESANEIADVALNAIEGDCISTFREKMPPNSDKDKPHARDNVVLSNIRTSRRGSRYRVIGVGDLEGGRINYERFRYLFYVENGHSRASARPFIDEAERAVEKIAVPKMKEALGDEIIRRLEG